ncbi:MAG: glycosyltransferase [bacterium]
MVALMIITTLSFCFCLLIYGIYIWAVVWGEHYQPDDELRSFVPLSVVIPARNEEKVIGKKIENLARIDYPNELLQVVVVDDASNDRTAELAEQALKDYGLNGLVLVNQQRMGTNYNYNEGFKHVVHDLVITTDADVCLAEDALKKIIAVLQNDPKVGAVCGELVPIIEARSLSAGVEKPYRDIYGKICAWESRLHSTYCFNGPFIALRKQAYSPMHPEKGASDANIALAAIRNGYQAKYVHSARFYEWIPINLSQQKRQKIRRAARLLESTWLGRDLLWNKRVGLFGKIVLPLRMAMLFLVPSLCLLSLILGGVLVYRVCGLFPFSLYLLGAGMVMTLGSYRTNLISSFLWHQYYLFNGLINMIKPMHVWESIDRVS